MEASEDPMSKVIQNDVRDSRFGATALVLAILSSLLYFLFSDGFRFLLQALVSVGRNLTVVA